MPNVTEGPFVQVACFCENVIEDKTGSISIIRIIDTLTHSQAGPTPPPDLPEFTHQFKLVLMFKSGAAKGRFDLRVVPELPNGSTENAVVVTAYFDGEERGQNIIADMVFKFTLEGLYWFDVFLGDVKLTSMPLRIKYNRVIVGSTAPTAGP